MTEHPRETIVENERKIDHTSGKLISEKRESLSLKRSISNTGKDMVMKNRLFSYFVAGLIFGTLFLFYFEVIDRFMNTIHINEKNPLSVWAFVSIEFLLIFGAWLIPTLYPARSEFRHSRKIIPSVIAVMVMWGSAVFGYYLTYTAMLAFVGLPNDWASLFPQLILFKLLRRIIIGVIVGGIARLITSSLYSYWVRKTNTTLSAY
jgi:hypothetical protein